MDVTEQFWELVKQLAQRNNIEQVVIQLHNDSDASSSYIAKQRLMRKPIKESAFMAAASRVDKGIREVAEFLKEHQAEYISAGGSSEQQRDMFESEVRSCVQACSSGITRLQKSVVAASQRNSGNNDNEQDELYEPINTATQAHLHGVVLCLSERLQGVCGVFDKWRSDRYSHSKSNKNQLGSGIQQAQMQQAVERSSGNYTGEGGASDEQEQDNAFQQSVVQTQISAESKQLIEALLQRSKQAEQTEQQMREVSTLNQLMSAQLVQQAEQIEMLYDEAVMSTQHLSKGNVQLQRTIQVNKSSRRMMIIIMLAASFGLLILDWLAG